jgi:hypothetical protein
MKPGRLLQLAALAAAVHGWSSHAAADPATAEALFEEGRRLLEAGDNERACDKFKESQAQDPGSGTLINLALCNERLGRLAAAWAHYRLAATMARRDGMLERATAAEAKASELEPRLPRLTLRATQPPPGLQVTWGERVFGKAALDIALPVDPGEHPLIVSAPGYDPVTSSLTILEGETRVLELPRLSPVAAPAASPPRVASPPPPVTTPSRSEPPRRNVVLPIALAGAGVAAFGIGSYFGVTALTQYASAEDACPSHHGCAKSALDSRASAQTRAWAANVSFGVGAVAVGLATYFWFSGATHEQRVVLGISNEGVAVRGKF